MNKKIVHDALILTAFTLTLGFVLGLVYGITKEPIAAADAATALTRRCLQKRIHLKRMNRLTKKRPLP